MSGSVEDDENTVTGAAIGNPLRRMTRLTTPRRDTYGPSAAELSLLATLDREGAPQMLGLIAGAGAERIRASNAYEDALGDVNRQQEVLARMANETEQRNQDVRLATTAMQTPNFAAQFPMVARLMSPEGRNILGELSNAELELRRSQGAENRAQAARALRPPSAETPSTRTPDIGALQSRAELAARDARDAMLRSLRRQNEIVIGTGPNARRLPQSGYQDPTPDDLRRAEEAAQAARIRVLREAATLDPRLAPQINSLLGAPQQQTAPPPAQTETAPALTPAQIAVRDAQRAVELGRITREEANRRLQAAGIAERI